MKEKLLFAASGVLLVLCLALFVDSARQASDLRSLREKLGSTEKELADLKQQFAEETKKRKDLDFAMTKWIRDIQDKHRPLPILDGKGDPGF